MTTPDDDHAYFRAIEDLFIALRGTPFLLAPADWRLAQRWHREGIPLGLIERTLRELFARRQAEGKEKVRTLRYCRAAVEAAWRRQRELAAPGHRGEAAEIDVAARLAALAAALPPGLPGGRAAARRIRSLSGTAEAVERQLGALETELLEGAEEGLDDAARQELERALAEVLTTLGRRLPAAELARATSRLRRQLLRQRLGLPVLSLFAGEAAG